MPVNDTFASSKFTLSTCEDEYAKDSRINRDDVQQLMEWAEKQSHMPKVKEFMLIQFYQASDYSTENAKKLAETYYTFKNEAPELFTGLDYNLSQYSCSFWDVIYCMVLPKETPEHYKLIYCGFKDPNPSKMHVESTLRMYQKTMLTRIMSQGSGKGCVFIYDTKGLSIGHFATLTISLIRKYLYFVQEVEPIHIREVHILNVHSIMDKLMVLMKPFMKKELYDMIRMHSNMDQFFKHVSKDLIPVDLGGTLPQTRDELQEQTKCMVNSLAQFVEEELKLRVNESKRFTSKLREDALTNGSFKQLLVD